MLLRLVTKRGLRILLYGSMVVVVAWTIVMTLYASYFCVQSGSSNWAGSKTCEAVGFFRTSSNIVIDYFCKLTLPSNCADRFNISFAKVKCILIGDRCFSSHLYPLECADEPETENQRTFAPRTRSLVSVILRYHKTWIADHGLSLLPARVRLQL